MRENGELYSCICGCEKSNPVKLGHSDAPEDMVMLVCSEHMKQPHIRLAYSMEFGAFVDDYMERRKRAKAKPKRKPTRRTSYQLPPKR